MMSPATRSKFSALLAFAVAASTLLLPPVAAQATGTFPPVPLASKHFKYPEEIPQQVDTDQGLIRGFQKGYNRCNSTTENQESLCQTSFVNSIDDFCLWAPSEKDSEVANTEGEMVAWCTKPGRGTRLIPRDALKGVQFMRTPAYAQVVGFLDQSKINIKTGDFGGEMDPHGADLRGNPMGGLMYSNAFGPGGNQFTQVIEWHNFMGGEGFCIKVCDPANPDAAHFCEHRLDRIGCTFNAPNNAQSGTFESCKGENQDFPGVYTTNGQVVTYTQPPEELGPITSIPYTARVPSSSECQQFTSSALYSALASVTASGEVSSAASTGAPTSAGSSGTSRPANGATTSRTGTAPGASNTSNDAQMVAASGIVTVLGVVFSVVFFS